MGKTKDYEVKQHQLFISGISLWKKLKRQNKISPDKKAMSRKINRYVFFTTPLQWLQSFILFFRLSSVNLKKNPPVFVVGHWRSGTTHLHYLLAQDKQFSYLENFQAFFYKIAFVTKPFMKPLLNKFMPNTRPQDNIKITADSPAEEEHPLTNLTEKSGMQTFFFPKNRSYYDKYNIFKDTTQKEKESWKKTYFNMLKQIALFRGKEKRLLLKNPHNTGRIEILKEIFPDAKFIFIHRNPYDVFQSNLHLYNKTIKTQFLQNFSDEEITERVLYCYETTMQKYIVDQSKLKDDQLIEVSYEELSESPVNTLEKIYDQLHLGNFDNVKPDIQSYLNTIKNYKRNSFKDLKPELLKKINNRWDFAFDHWNYDKL